MKKISILIGLVFLVSCMSVSAALVDNIVLSYKMDTNSATLTNYAPGGSDATLTGSLNTATGFINNSLNFTRNYANYYALTPYTNFTNARAGNYTFSVWVNMPSSCTGGEPCSIYSERTVNTESINIHTFSDNTMSIYAVKGSSRRSVVDYNIGSYIGKGWFNIMFTFNNDTNNVSIYLNNTLVNSAITTEIGTGTATNYYIGRGGYTGANQGFLGLIDEMNVFNKVLTDSERLMVYNSSGTYPFGSITISFNLSTPVNNTYTYNTTPNFVGNITALTGTWNISLITNGTSRGMSQYNTTGVFNITSTTLTGGEYSWWFNATSSTDANNSYVTGRNNLYVVANVTSGNCTATTIKTCQFGAGSIAIGSITGCN